MPYAVKLINSIPSVIDSVSQALVQEGKVINIRFPTGVLHTHQGDTYFINGAAVAEIYVDGNVYYGVPVL